MNQQADVDGPVRQRENSPIEENRLFSADVEVDDVRLKATPSDDPNQRFGVMACS
nr:hypothetical protein [Paludisphaera rhizosphaerae]